MTRAPASGPRPPAWLSRPTVRTLAKLAGAAVLCGALAAGVLLPFVGGVGAVADSAANQFLNTSCDLVIQPAQQTSTVLAADGRTVIATLFAQNRQDVALNQVPQHVQNALIATEDRRFYSHHGVDLRGLVRAAVHNGGGDGTTQGGSTLTMQYVKQVRYYQAGTAAERAAAIQQDLSRKIQDAKCAIDLEKRYTKPQILDDYLNIAFFGENSYGIETAARTYFGNPASRLSIAQGATLIGLLQSPSELDPFVNPGAARARRDQVLDNMVANGNLGPAAAATAKATPLRLSGSTPPPVREGCANATPAIANAGFFCDYAISWLSQHGGLSAHTVQTGGLRIVTTLNASLQNTGQQAVWHSGLDPASATALVMPSVDPRSGAVQTMITSRHYGVGPGQTTLPLFTAGSAGSGSTYKYFTALTALKLGVQPDFTLTTGSSTYNVRNCPTDANTQLPTIHNAGNYRATLPLSSALPESVNTYFVGMEDQLFGCNLAPVVQTALDLGMATLRQPDRAGSPTTIAQATVAEHRYSFTLGDTPTSPLELTAAYGAAANDGVFCPADPISSVTGPDGAPVKYTRPACTRQFDPQVARALVKIMTADTTGYSGTAGSYFSSWYAAGGSPVASKTGTDSDDPKGPDGGNGNSALWFAGITPTLASAAALINPVKPNATVSGLPADVSNNGSDIFGAYASTFWLDAYGPTLSAEQWSWPDANDVPNGVQVPDLDGKSPQDATAALMPLGLSGSVATVPCGSGEPAGTVGYYEPHLAAPGSKITLCLSTGVAPVGSYTPSYGYPGYSYPSYGNPGSGTGTGGGQGSPAPSSTAPSSPAPGSTAPGSPAPSSPGAGSPSRPSAVPSPTRPRG